MSESRKEKYANRPLKKFSAVAPFFYLTTRPGTLKNAWRFIFTIIRDFFLLQMAHQLHIKRRPVINVETDIDEKIPFEPSYVNVYLGFVQFFVRPMDMLKKRLGFKKAAPYLSLYLKYLTLIYKNASSIYRFCLTTTTRPAYRKEHAFRVIHLFDPHLLCVPSIHVSISAGSYAWFRQLFQTGLLPPQEAEFRLAEIKEQAIQIVESVLFIKQHSVNCVPLALYMISSTMGNSFFSAKDAMEFVEELFVNTPEISDDVRSEITEHFCYMYDRALLESKYSDDWQSCICHWLSDFAAQTGQSLE